MLSSGAGTDWDGGFLLSLQPIWYCGVLARTVLITHQCFGYCWIVLTQYQTFLISFPSSLRPISRVGMAKELKGNTAKPNDPKWPKAYSIPVTLCSLRKSGGRGRRALEAWRAGENKNCLSKWPLLEDRLGISLC